MWFDRLYFSVMFFTVLTCQRNVNILGIVALTLLLRFIDESAYFLLDNLNLPSKALLYGVVGYFFWFLRYDPLSPLLFSIFLLTITAEIYWLYSAYPAPEVNWEILLIFLNLLARHCLFRRVMWTERFFPQKGCF